MQRIRTPVAASQTLPPPTPLPRKKICINLRLKKPLAAQQSWRNIVRPPPPPHKKRPQGLSKYALYNWRYTTLGRWHLDIFLSRVASPESVSWRNRVFQLCVPRFGHFGLDPLPPLGARSWELRFRACMNRYLHRPTFLAVGGPRTHTMQVAIP